MSRKVYVTVSVNMILDVEDFVSVGDVINEMNYEFTPDNPLEVDILDTEIVWFEVTGVK